MEHTDVRRPADTASIAPPTAEAAPIRHVGRRGRRRVAIASGTFAGVLTALAVATSSPGAARSAAQASTTPRPTPAAPADRPPDVERVRVFDATRLHFEETRPERTDGAFVVRWESQVAARVVDLPDPAPRGEPLSIRGILTVRPGSPDPEANAGQPLVDPWTRLGTVTIAPVGEGERLETELIRFTTGYGAGGRYEADLTSLAPLLRGRRLLRVFIATYGDTPGWEATFDLVYERASTGRRDPLLATPVFDAPHVAAGDPVVRRTVTVPAGTDTPRLRILSTGHATDGTGANEFVSAAHELRIDGRLVARWRPWRENGPALRPLNPWAGTINVGQRRDVRASDLDRSGWGPGLIVEPKLILLPELEPGLREIELRITGIRPAVQGSPEHGYFAVNATLLADRAWD